MKTRALVALATLSLLVITACSTPSQTLGAGQFKLKPSESLTSADGYTMVTFVEVSEDSRCATGVECIWAGQVKIVLEVAVGTETQQNTLVNGTLLEGDVDSIDVAEYKIRLIKVDPYPVFEQPTDAADYQITLEVQ